jgi:hypothetical protein
MTLSGVPKPDGVAENAPHGPARFDYGRFAASVACKPSALQGGEGGRIFGRRARALREG